ncbi:hypothetical protein PJL15_04516 [Paenarthrobacter nitroguajacolicus]|nr:hypothetical protein [Paenarthrobacter nitroguajacolicus]
MVSCSPFVTSVVSRDPVAPAEVVRVTLFRSELPVLERVTSFSTLSPGSSPAMGTLRVFAAPGAPRAMVTVPAVTAWEAEVEEVKAP